MTRVAPVSLMFVVAFPVGALCSELPTLESGTPYPAARLQLEKAGWVPTSLSKEPNRCPRGFEAICNAYPETAACSKKAACAFFWRKQALVIEVGTRGRESLRIEHVRCRIGCP